MELLEPTQWAGKRVVATYRPPPGAGGAEYALMTPMSAGAGFDAGGTYECWVEPSGATVAMRRRPDWRLGGLVLVMGVAGLLIAVLLVLGMIRIEAAYE